MVSLNNFECLDIFWLMYNFSFKYDIGGCSFPVVSWYNTLILDTKDIFKKDGSNISSIFEKPETGTSE